MGLGFTEGILRTVKIGWSHSSEPEIPLHLPFSPASWGKQPNSREDDGTARHAHAVEEKKAWRNNVWPRIDRQLNEVWFSPSPRPTALYPGGVRGKGRGFTRSGPQDRLLSLDRRQCRYRNALSGASSEEQTYRHRVRQESCPDTLVCASNALLGVQATPGRNNIVCVRHDIISAKLLLQCPRLPCLYHSVNHRTVRHGSVKA